MEHGKVWILGTRFVVDEGESFLASYSHRKSSEFAERMAHEGLCSLGNFNGKPPFICVRKGMDEQYQRETALHEMVHAVDMMLSGTEGALSESVVQRWSRGMFATLTDPRNAWFVDWIFERERVNILESIAYECKELMLAWPKDGEEKDIPPHMTRSVAGLLLKLAELDGVKEDA